MARNLCSGRSARVFRCFGALALLISTACSLPPSSPPKAEAPVARLPSGALTQTGIASWYGPGFHGRPTASGEIYNQFDLTAAHQTLPLGTRVMVTNLENQRSTEVLINDRGPFMKGRVIDLSYAAAHMLGMIAPGTIPVRVEVLDSGPPKISAIRASLDYTLQTGAFVSLDNARQLKEDLGRIYPEVSPAAIVRVQGRDAVYYRVQLGTFSDRSEAEEHARQLAKRGLSAIILEK